MDINSQIDPTDLKFFLAIIEAARISMISGPGRTEDQINLTSGSMSNVAVNMGQKYTIGGYMKETIGGRIGSPNMRTAQIHSNITQGTYGGIGTKCHITMGIKPDVNP